MTEPDVFILPASSAQQRLWFLDQLDPGNPAYNLPVAVRLIGPLKVTALEKSFQVLIQRHEILRTTLSRQNQQPVQVVHDKSAYSTFDLTILDLKLDLEKDTDTDSRLQAVLSKAIRQPFDLSCDHLLRGSLIQRHDNEHILLLVMHHIIADNWSMGVLVQELAAIYPALAANQPVTLPDLPIQYADFAVWQQQQLQSGQLQPQLDYWIQQLADLTPLQLPSDRPHPTPPSRRGAKQTWTLSPQLTSALRQLSQKTDVTLFMLLLGAFKTLLYRYTGCSDVVVGSPIANRNQPETQPLIGFFVNTLVLRSQLQPDLTFLNLLTQIRKTTLDAYEHQDLPFEKLVEALHPDRSLHQPPLFQVWFALHHAPMSDLKMGSLTLEPLSLQPDTVQFDLSLEVMESPEILTIAIEYDLDLFDAPTIGRWFEHWQTLLTGIVAHPEQTLSELPLLPATEQYQVLVEWNKTQQNYAQVGCLHHLFEQQVKNSPGAIALVFEDQQLTYQDLNQQANQLAHYLQTLGVESGTLVGLCLERSPAMVISLLAILKAGGAYVPLDPSYPVERLRFMLQDSQIEVLVAQQRSTIEPHISTANMAILERDQTLIAQHSLDNPKTEVTDDHLAYVIYTSGSTGQPKGVMIEHRALMNFTLAATEVYEIEASDRILQFASISFDTAAEEIFPALTQGSTLVLRTEAMLHSFSAFLEACQVAEITVLDLPTAFWQQLVTELTAGRASLPVALRLIIIGGEAVSPQAVAAWQQIGAGVRLVNSYGPTETTVVAMVSDLSDDWPVSSTAPVVIGRPLPNVQSYVLDAEQKPVPIGIPGELYIGGKGLAKGYLNRPKLSAERFILNPVRKELSALQAAVSARLYRTGDRARYRTDGNLEFLGRLDDQVKIRGYRVELGEIETALQQHPTVQNAVVVLREDSPGQPRLAAYVVLHQALEPAESIEAFVAQRLPAYMVPATFSVLTAFPLTPNGKVDRQALPVPAALQQAAYSAPQTDTETTLADIWAEVLGLEQVGIHDNFFSLGGDSILSIQVIARANQAGLTLTPKQLFEHQTVATLAAVAGTSALVQAEQGPVVGAVPLTPIQRWFFEQAFAEPQHWNQAVLLESEQPLTPVLLQQTIQHLRAHHDGLRSRFVCVDNAWQQEILPLQPEHTVLELIDLAAVAAEEQPAALEAHANRLQASLDLAKGALLRVALFDRGPGQSQRLLIIVHHLVMDGVSWRILLQDFQTVYQQLSQQQAVQLPPKTSAFQAWAQQLNDYVKSAELEQETDFWLEMLGQPVVPLPQHSGENTSGSDGSTADQPASSQPITLEFGLSETQFLLQHSAQIYDAQLHEILLTALLLSLQQWTGQSACLIDLEGHGREPLFPTLDVSRTLGWFTTVYPAYFRLDALDFDSALHSTKSQLQAVTQHGIHYGLLRYLKSPPLANRLKALPQASILFNYLGKFDLAPSQWALAAESSGASYSAQNHRNYALEINGLVMQGCLQLTWAYDECLHSHSTIAALAQVYLEQLRSLIPPNYQHEEKAMTTEFSWTSLNSADVDAILDTVEFEGNQS